MATSGSRALVTLLAVTAALPLCANARSPKDGRITSASGEITLSGDQAPVHNASVNETFAKNAQVVTGKDSRVELTFNNQVVARLSANAALTFRNELELTDGAVLIQAPHAAKAKVRAADVAVDVTDATALLELHNEAFKFLVLEGAVRIYRPAHLGDSLLVRAGQMVFGSTKAALTDPVDFEIARFLKTCPLIQGFSPLASDKALSAAGDHQQRAKAKKNLTETNLVIFGGGSVVWVQSSDKPTPTKANQTDAAPQANDPTSQR